MPIDKILLGLGAVANPGGDLPNNTIPYEKPSDDISKTISWEEAKAYKPASEITKDIEETIQLADGEEELEGGALTLGQKIIFIEGLIAPGPENPMDYINSKSEYAIAHGNYMLQTKTDGKKLYLGNSVNSRKVEVDVVIEDGETKFKIVGVDVNFVAENTKLGPALAALIMATKHFALTAYDKNGDSQIDRSERNPFFVTSGDVASFALGMDVPRDSKWKIRKKENREYFNDDKIAAYDVFPLIQENGAMQSIANEINKDFRATNSTTTHNNKPRVEQSGWMYKNTGKN